MNPHWRPAEFQPTYTDSTSSFSPSFSYKNQHLSNAIAPGTVASRIQFLQRLSDEPPTTPPPTRLVRPAANRRREHSRSSFGRRPANIFGSPAARNLQPSEEPQTHTNHSYLGLQTPRSNHEKQHAIVGSRPQLVRTDERPRQFQLKRVKTAPQHVAASSPPTASNTHKGDERNSSKNRVDIQRGVDRLQNNLVLQPPTVFDSRDQQNRRNPRSSGEVRSRQDGTIESNISTRTTSTVRRKSVRDLFDAYGIERPSGLASSEDAALDESHKLKRHRICHICLWIHDKNEHTCFRCAHRFCKACDFLSPSPNVQRDSDYDELKPENASSGSKNMTSAGTPRPTQNHSKKNLLRPLPVPIQKPMKYVSLEQRPIVTEPFPKFDLKKSPISATHVASTNQKHGIIDFGSLLPITRGFNQNKRTESAKFTPTTARQDVKQSSRLDSITEYENQHLYEYSPNSQPSQTDECSCPNCVPSYEKNVHSNSGQGNKSATSGMENDYNEASTYLDDNTQAQVSPSPSSKANQLKSQLPSSPILYDSQLRAAYGVNYVECRGYPRTGHHHADSSPVSSGIVGECQHCLNDCACSACQSTHHSVRCCTHETHKAIVHHHHSPAHQARKQSYFPNTLKYNARQKSIDGVTQTYDRRSRFEDPNLSLSPCPEESWSPQPLNVPIKTPAKPSSSRLTPSVSVQGRQVVSPRTPSPTPPTLSRQGYKPNTTSPFMKKALRKVEKDKGFEASSASGFSPVLRREKPNSDLGTAGNGLYSAPRRALFGPRTAKGQGSMRYNTPTKASGSVKQEGRIREAKGAGLVQGGFNGGAIRGIDFARWEELGRKEKEDEVNTFLEGLRKFVNFEESENGKEDMGLWRKDKEVLSAPIRGVEGVKKEEKKSVEGNQVGNGDITATVSGGYWDASMRWHESESDDVDAYQGSSVGKCCEGLRSFQLGTEGERAGNGEGDDEAVRRGGDKERGAIDSEISQIAVEVGRPEQETEERKEGERICQYLRESESGSGQKEKSEAMARGEGVQKNRKLLASNGENMSTTVDLKISGGGGIEPDFKVKGITIIIHIDGGEDLVLKSNCVEVGTAAGDDDGGGCSKEREMGREEKKRNSCENVDVDWRSGDMQGGDGSCEREMGDRVKGRNAFEFLENLELFERLLRGKRESLVVSMGLERGTGMGRGR